MYFRKRVTQQILPGLYNVLSIFWGWNMVLNTLYIPSLFGSSWTCVRNLLLFDLNESRHWNAGRFRVFIAQDISHTGTQKNLWGLNALLQQRFYPTLPPIARYFLSDYVLYLYNLLFIKIKCVSANAKVHLSYFTQVLYVLSTSLSSQFNGKILYRQQAELSNAVYSVISL